MSLGIGGSQLITADAAVCGSGICVRIFSIHIISGGGGGGVAILRSGISTSGTARIQETGTASTGKTFSYGKCGVLFESGCFCDVDANVTSVLVEYVREA
jgi:hypothetical protein